jgi:hypothetical protein
LGCLRRRRSSGSFHAQRKRTTIRVRQWGVAQTGSAIATYCARTRRVVVRIQPDRLGRLAGPTSTWCG